MKDLSIIIPFVGEYPQILFTIRSVAEEFIGTDIDFEIIAVNNYCKEVETQAFNSLIRTKDMLSKVIFREGRELMITDMIKAHKEIMCTYEDKSGTAIAAAVKGNNWLKYFEYTGRLSHWQAKRMGVEESSGRILLFLDAHVLSSKGSLVNMYEDYCTSQNFDGDYYCEIGTFHLPLTYKILEYHRLIYKIVVDNDVFYSYSFTPYRENVMPYEVPCMSTCGMMINRDIYRVIGGWPEGLGIYGGGENFMNYTLAVCGYKKFIYPFGALYHHGEKRDYHYVYDDLIKNRMIAHYLFGGEDLLKRLAKTMKGNPQRLEQLAREAVDESKIQRGLIKSYQKTTIEEWARQWLYDK